MTKDDSKIILLLLTCLYQSDTVPLIQTAERAAKEMEMVTKRFRRYAFRGFTPESVKAQAEREKANVGKVQECSWIPTPAKLIDAYAEIQSEDEMYLVLIHEPM